MQHHNSLHFFSWNFFLFKRISFSIISISFFFHYSFILQSREMQHVNFRLKQKSTYHNSLHFFAWKFFFIHKTFIYNNLHSFFSQGKCNTWIFIWNKNPPTTIPFTFSLENSFYSQTFIYNNLLHFILQSREMQHVNFYLKQKSTYHNSLHFFTWKFFLFKRFYFQQSSSFHSSVKGNAAREFSFETKIHVSQFPSLLHLKILLIQKILFSTIFFNLLYFILQSREMQHVNFLLKQNSSQFPSLLHLKILLIQKILFSTIFFISFFSQGKCSTWIFIWNKNPPTTIPFTSSLENSSLFIKLSFTTIFIHSSVKGNATREFSFETKIHLPQFPSLFLLKILLIHKLSFTTIFFISFFSQGKCSTWIFIWNKNPRITIPFTSLLENSSYSKDFIFNNLLHFILQSREMQHVNFHLKQKSTYHNSLHFFTWKFFLFKRFYFQQSSLFHSSVKGNAAREFSFETKLITIPFTSSLENSSYSKDFIFNNLLHFILQSREMQHVNFYLK